MAVWRKDTDVLLIAGGAAGTLAMIANLWGDVVGFITPVVVLLWPLAAYGLQSVIRAITTRESALIAAGGFAMLLPIWNIYTIHPAIERLRLPGEGPALRANVPTVAAEQRARGPQLFHRAHPQLPALLQRIRSGSESTFAR